MPDFGRWTANGGDPSLNEINRTDRFLDALAAEQQVYATDPGEAELAQLLGGWRDEVRRTPATAMLTARDAEAALQRASSSPGKRTRFALRAVGSVAAAFLCLGGFGAAVYGAGPGDALYGVRTTLFGGPVTRDQQVVLAAQTELAEVQQLIDNRQWSAAQDKLQVLTTTVATVDDSERKQQLANQWQQLSVKVENRDPNATVPPGAPPVTLPEPAQTTSGASSATSSATSSDTTTSGTTSATTSVTTSVTTSATTSSATTSGPSATSGPSGSPSDTTSAIPPTSQTAPQQVPSTSVPTPTTGSSVPPTSVEPGASSTVGSTTSSQHQAPTAALTTSQQSAEPSTVTTATVAPTATSGTAPATHGRAGTGGDGESGSSAGGSGGSRNEPNGGLQNGRAAERQAGQPVITTPMFQPPQSPRLDLGGGSHGQR